MSVDKAQSTKYRHGRKYIRYKPMRTYSLQLKIKKVYSMRKRKPHGGKTNFGKL